MSSSKWQPFCLGLNELTLLALWNIQVTKCHNWCRQWLGMDSAPSHFHYKFSLTRSNFFQNGGWDYAWSHSNNSKLTHWGWDKMAVIFHMTLENVRISNKILLKFVPMGLINNIPALVQIMAWRRTGNKPYLNRWWLVYWHIYAALTQS